MKKIDIKTINKLMLGIVLIVSIYFIYTGWNKKPTNVPAPFNISQKDKEEIKEYQGLNVWETITPGLTTSTIDKVSQILAGRELKTENSSDYTAITYEPESTHERAVATFTKDNVLRVVTKPSMKKVTIEQARNELKLQDPDVTLKSICQGTLELEVYTNAGLAFLVNKYSREIYQYIYFEQGNNKDLLKLSNNSYELPNEERECHGF